MWFRRLDRWMWALPSAHTNPKSCCLMWTHLESESLNTEASIFLNSYIDGIADYMLSLEGHCESM